MSIGAIKDRIAYNAHDLGEFGKVIRLQYLFNILDDLMLQPLSTPKRPDEIVRKAAMLRWAHYIEQDAEPLPWPTLTDAQKLPWLLKAASE